MMHGCPACGGRSFDATQPVTGVVEHRCVDCGLLIGELQRSGPVTAEFERVDEARYLRAVGAARRRQARPILELLRQHAAPGVTVLDVGCSFGFFLQAARDAGFKVRGVEPDPQAWRHATALLGEGVVEHGWFRGDDEGVAEVIVTLDVLEHVPVAEQDGFGRSIRRSLGPGGVWVTKVPSTDGLYYRLSRHAAQVAPRIGETLLRRMWQTEYEYPHTVYFNRSSLARWLESHGFELLTSVHLPEVPFGTTVERLTTDGAIGPWTARLLAPGLYAVTAIDALRRRSDALVAIARPT